MKKTGLLMLLALMSADALSNSAVGSDASNLEVSAMNFRLDSDTFGKKVDGFGVKIEYELERKKQIGYKLSYQNFTSHRKGVSIDAELGKAGLSYTYPMLFNGIQVKVKPSVGVAYGSADPLDDMSLFASIQLGSELIENKLFVNFDYTLLNLELDHVLESDTLEVGIKYMLYDDIYVQLSSENNKSGYATSFGVGFKF